MCLGVNLFVYIGVWLASWVYVNFVSLADFMILAIISSDTFCPSFPFLLKFPSRVCWYAWWYPAGLHLVSFLPSFLPSLPLSFFLLFRLIILIDLFKFSDSSFYWLSEIFISITVLFGSRIWFLSLYWYSLCWDIVLLVSLSSLYLRQLMSVLCQGHFMLISLPHLHHVLPPNGTVFLCKLCNFF